MSALLEVRVADHGIALNTWAGRTDALAADLAEALARPEVASARRVNLTALTSPGSSPDFAWVRSPSAADRVLLALVAPTNPRTVF